MTTLLKETHQKVSTVFVHIRVFINKGFASTNNAKKAYDQIFKVINSLSPEEGQVLKQVLSPDQYEVIKQIATAESFEAYSRDLIPRHLQHRMKVTSRQKDTVRNVFKSSHGDMDFHAFIEESLKEADPVMVKPEARKKQEPKPGRALSDLQERMRQRMLAAQGKTEPEPEPTVNEAPEEPEEPDVSTEGLGEEDTLAAINARLAARKAAAASSTPMRTRTRTAPPAPKPAPPAPPAPKEMTEEEKVAAQLAAMRSKMGNKGIGAARTRTR